ncbi:MAG TPA: DUF4184 family protein [Myxococcota bacterium]|nr:DUF4184 family protein [Myxococcota bacterium]
MPLTVAHPAAAVVLARPLGRAGVLSALVVGSIVPDLHYFLPLPVSREATHSLPGLLWFCLPVGVLVYVSFHRALKQPLLGLLPTSWQERLSPLVYARPSLPAAPWWAVAVSILVGALSHVVWDALAHATGPVAELFPFLDTLLFTVAGYPVQVYRVVLHGSSLIGTLLLLRWSLHWMRRAEPAGSAPPRLSPTLRIVILAGLLGMASLVALPQAQVPRRVNLRSLQNCVVSMVAPALAAFGSGVLLYCAAWHCFRAARRFERP